MAPPASVCNRPAWGVSCRLGLTEDCHRVQSIKASGLLLHDDIDNIVSRVGLDGAAGMAFPARWLAKSVRIND
jgi:hypothetical protein